MKKRTGIIVIVLSVLLTALMVFTAISGWGKSGIGSMRNIKTGLDLSGGVSITYEASEAVPSQSDMNDTIYKLQQRIEQYSTEANVYQEGANRINVEIPGVTDANEILEDLGTPGSLYFIAETDADGNRSYDLGADGYELNYTIEELEAKGAIVASGSDVASSDGVASTSDQTKGTQYVVRLSFNKSATEAFAEATRKAVSKGETIGIYYDGRFVSVPRVNSAITDGNCIIEGMSSMEEANQLASFIRIGGLSLTLNEIRSNVVGASLGQEALRTSLIGGAIGLGIVCLIMIIVYLLPGVIASFVLVLYAALILVLLNAFDLTLTLPGIAGIILSIGMAVDANVIIYTRISEEISQGTSVLGAIRSGFHKAMSAIIDGNVTTLIAAAVLGALGTGTIKGFAMTLAIGVALSLFTACFVSRVIVLAVYALGARDQKLWARKKRITNIDFVGIRKITYSIMAVVLACGIIAMGVNAAGGRRALNFSLDFLGGSATTVDFNEDYSLAELESQVTPVVSAITGDNDISYQTVVNSKQVIIKTRTLTPDERTDLTNALTENFGVAEGAVTTENISAVVGTEMRNAAILAVVIAVALMLLYIFIRFHDIRFASAAVIALIHDVLITLTAYAILRIPVGNSFIAVMLTILGYSINSTIVIFDRIRENLEGFPKNGNLKALVNLSDNQTLTRSIFTNLTTFSSIVILYVVGVASIKEFTLPMLVGIVAGTFSSVFLTAPLWYLMRTNLGKDAAPYKEAAAKAEREAAREAVNAANPADNGGIRSASNPNVIRKKKKK